MHRHALGKLQFEKVCRQLGIGQNTADQVGQAAVAKLHDRQIHRHDHRWMTAIQPLLELVHGSPEHPLADRQDQTAILGNRNELHRRNRAKLGVTPAQQCLHTDHLAVAKGKLRLEMQLKLIVLQRPMHRVNQLHAPGRGGLHFGREEAIAVSAFFLGAVHRRIRTA